MNGNLSYEEGLRMAHLMKERHDDILEAINQTIATGHGVVALRFSSGCRFVNIEILDEPLDGNVRVYPG